MKIITENIYVLMSLLVITSIIMTIPVGAINDEAMGNTSNITPVAYKSFIDQDYGFYRVINIIADKPAPYENNTLIINVGDIVIWQNDAAPDEPLTVISEQGLWKNRSAYLRWNYQKYDYIFNQPGTYSAYIKEYPRMQHQTIIVNSIPETIDVIPTPTVTLTANLTVNDTKSTNNTSTINNKTKSTSNISIINNKTSYANSGKTNLIPIRAIVVIAVLIILATYIFRKRK